MHFDLTPAQDTFRADAESFARTEVAPQAARIDETGTFPRDLVQKAAARGYLGMLAPADAGGRAVDHLSYALAIEAIARASATMAVILAVHNSLAVEVIARVGS